MSWDPYVNLEKEYYSEIRDKKRAGVGDFKKKRGSKSRKCTLPSDNMTKKELNKMNGEVKTYNMKKRYSYKELKTFPEDIQKEYLKNLMTTYNANNKMLGESLGVSQSIVSFYLKQFRLNPGKGNIKKPDEKQKNEWNLFINGNSQKLDIENKANATEKKEETKPVSGNSISLNSLSLEMTGDVSTILWLIEEKLHGKSGTIKISFEEKSNG